MSKKVREQSAQVMQMGQDWPLITALLGGTRAMRTAGKTYLPQFPAEDDEGYKARLATATLFEAFERTVDVLGAKPFSRPLTYGDDVPTRIVGTKTETGWAEDIDLQGRNLHVFAADVGKEALAYGLSGILVEYPQMVRPEGATRPLTQAEEKSAGVRPYFVQIHPQQLLGWRVERVNNAWKLQQFRFLEHVTEPDGEFGEKIVDQVRVLEPGSWRTYRKVADKDEWAQHKQGTTTLNVVPFVPVYGKRLGFMDARPPLAGLAYLNQKHWAEQSDQDKAVHYARIRLVAAIGIEDDQPLKVASDYILRMPPGSDIKVAQGSAESVNVGQSHLDKIEDQMRQAGAELLVIKPGNTSIPQTLADNEPGKCALQRIAEDLEDALDQALQLMAQWVQEPSGGHVTVFKDFGAATLAEASGELLLKAATAGKISDATLFEELQRRGLVSSERTWEHEQERLKDQPPPLGTIGGNDDGGGEGGGDDA